AQPLADRLHGVLRDRHRRPALLRRRARAGRAQRPEPGAADRAAGRADAGDELLLLHARLRAAHPHPAGVAAERVHRPVRRRGPAAGGGVRDRHGPAVPRLRARALGLALGVWLALGIVYDGLLLFVIARAQAYPIDRAVIAASLLNPIDLSRILVLLRLDTAALMGYTGALFRTFLGSTGGQLLAVGALLLWVAAPALLGLRAFKRKDF